MRHSGFEIPAVDDEDNVYFFNDEPIFTNENGHKCLWKQTTGLWWAGNCDDIGQNKGFPLDDRCHCPWSGKNGNNYDYQCLNENNCECKKSNTIPVAICICSEAGGVDPSHHSSTALLRQLQARIGHLNSGQKCRIQGGVLKVRLFPPPRRIICDYSRANSPPNLCRTKSGPSPNQPCIFPFTWNGKTYNGCPIDPEDSSERWCSTKVDSNGNHITGQGNWGHCNSKCRKQN